MLGSLSFYVSRNHPDFHTAANQSFEARRLYNTLNKVRHEFDNKRKDPSAQTPVANSLGIPMKNKTEANRKIIYTKQSINLPHKLGQGIARMLDEAWRSVITRRTRGLFAPSPGFKDRFSEVRYTKQAMSQKAGLHRVVPTGWKVGFELPRWIELTQVQSLLLLPKPDGFELKVLYRKEQTLWSEGSTFAAIDLGLNNLATIITTNGNRPKVVSGKRIKSINQYTNKQVASLKGGEAKYRKRLWWKRDRQLNHILNSASNEIVKYLQQNDVQCLVIGWSSGFKDSINIGRRNNQNFISVPHARFRDQIKRKCEETGIRVVIHEESYTSKASFLDGDVIPIYNDKTKHKFSGRRTTRGNYKAGDGTLIHADVNGAWNILRKSNLPIGQTSRVCSYPERLRIQLSQTDYL